MRNIFQKISLFLCALMMVAAVLAIPEPGLSSSENRFGVNSFVSNRYSWQSWHKPVEQINNLGVSWIREEFVWALIEPEKGSYNWGFYDGAFQELEKSNVNVLGIVDYSAPWSTANPSLPGADKYMPDLSLWEGYVRAVVGRYKDKVEYWQVWNEPNIVTFFKPEPNIDSYISLLSVASRVIREVDPDAKIVLGGMSGVDVGYVGIMREKGASDLFDILAFHPYQSFRSIPEESGYLRDLSNAQKMGDLFNKPIWVTELGWPTDETEGVSDELQAQYLVRSYVLSFLYPRIEKVFWYDLRNDGENKSDREQNFGLMHRGYVHKKSYKAYQQLISTLGGVHFSRDNSDYSNGIFDISFTGNNKNIRVVWRTKGEGALKIKNNPGVVVRYLDRDEKINSGGDIYLKINSSPAYIVSNSEIVDQKKDGDVYSYEYVDQSPFVRLSKGDKASLRLTIKNSGNVDWVKNGVSPRVMIGTCRDRDRHSVFYSSSWIGANRASTHNEDLVRPGQTATFDIAIDSSLAGVGKYREYFCPMVEGVSWMKDKGIYWEVAVNNSGSYNYEYVSQSSHMSLSVGEVSTAFVKLKNNGSKIWYKGEFNLGTSRSKDRASIFSHNWPANNRVTLVQDAVMPGEVGTFNINFKAGNFMKPGEYKEYFQPVVDGFSWMKDIGIYWNISVNN